MTLAPKRVENDLQREREKAHGATETLQVTSEARELNASAELLLVQNLRV